MSSVERNNEVDTKEMWTLCYSDDNIAWVKNEKCGK